MFRSVSRYFDQRLGLAKFANTQFGKVFPDHWSFMLGEITLYCFTAVIISGVYLSFFFEPSSRQVIYNGPYEALQGYHVSAAFDSAMHISFNVDGGLLMRQLHHWSALLFMAAMVVHMARVFFTGSFRKPREINWVFGVILLVLSMFNGLFGYSLLYDLLSGTGLRVIQSITLSIPVVGPEMAWWFFGGDFNSTSFLPRLYALHILILPAAIVGLLAAHLFLVWFQKHTQFRGEGRTEHNVVGVRILPTFAAKAIGMMFLVIGVLVVISGIFQINPIWEFGPFASVDTAGAVTSAAQPDWYMGWLDGLLRLIPGWETRLFGFEIPNYFWGGLVFAGVVFTGMGAYPWIEARITRDTKVHNLAERPRDNPQRTAVGAAFLALMVVIFTMSANDVIATFSHVAPEVITVAFRFGLIVVPLVTYFVALNICRELNGTNAHPAAPGPNHMVMRKADGGFEFAHGSHHDHEDDLVNDVNHTNAPPPTEDADGNPIGEGSHDADGNKIADDDGSGHAHAVDRKGPQNAG